MNDEKVIASGEHKGIKWQITEREWTMKDGKRQTFHDVLLYRSYVRKDGAEGKDFKISTQHWIDHCQCLAQIEAVIKRLPGTYAGAVNPLLPEAPTAPKADPYWSNPSETISFNDDDIPF